MGDSAPGPSLTDISQLLKEEKPTVNGDTDPDPATKQEIVNVLLEPKPSTSFFSGPYYYVEEKEEEVEGFVEIPPDKMEYPTNTASFEKSPCSKMSVCPFCGEKFFSHRILMVHLNLNHGSELQNKAHLLVLNSMLKECNICGYLTPFYTVLKRHMKLKHKINEPFHCTFCNFKTSVQVTLREHQGLYHSNKKLYQCLKCDFKALNNFSKRIHIHTVHIDGRIFHCSVCSFRAKRQSTLMKHMRSNHPDEISLKCKFCKYKTESFKKFKKHGKVKHPEEIPFQCTFCSYKSKKFNLFKKHLAVKHCHVYQSPSSWYPFI